MAQDFQYFYEDEVFRFNQKNQLELGMVLENAEFVSSDEDSDQEEEDKVTKGSIRVAWYPRGEEQVLPERKVGLGDRSLMPGDVVRRLIKGKDTQRGYCRQVHVAASVQVVGTKYVIVNVDSNLLTPLEEFTTDIAVALDSWVGMVNMVKSKIFMVTPDGSKCVLSDHEALDLDDARDPRDRDSEFRRYDFYPGQQLVGPHRAFDEAEWVHKTKEKENVAAKTQKLLKVSVEEVQVVQLGVRWQCRSFSNDPNCDKEQPKYIVQGDDLKRVRMLNVFEPCTLQLGDRNYYTLQEGDLLLPREHWRKVTAVTLMTDKSNPCPLRPRPAKHRKNASGGKHQQQVSNLVSGSGDLTTTDPSGKTSTGGERDSSTATKEPSSSSASVLTINADDTNDSDDFVDIDTDIDISDAASVNSEASTGSQRGRTKKGSGGGGGPALMTKVLRKKKLKRAKRKRDEAAREASSSSSPINPGDRLVVETLMTTSQADVVWQDGSVESEIPSTVLYPIHHLDDQEFFPGDFVVEQRDALNTHEYGVVQAVDHAGRTANVKWFHTYTAGSEPQPYFKCEQEVSVYDLRDHPDFRYRPGSVVIRVANYENGQICSTGQVLDNFPTGEVSVWWVDGTKSVCFPQDLYKVGEYDSDEGELWDDTASDGSWETESEHSVIAEESESETDNQLKTKLVANIEKARIAMSRLEEIFTQNPSLQTTAVMKQLLDCYKECRCMDKLMGTCFFHESNFQGLIEKVRERGRASTNQRMAEQFNRLFSTSSDTDNNYALSTSTTDNKNDINGLDYEETITKKDSNSNKKCKADRKISDSNGVVVPNGLTALNKSDILKSSTNLCENLANLSLTSSTASQSPHKLKQDNVRDSLRHKRMSETDMLNTDREGADINLKDSKSCGDLKSGASSCALLCCGGSPRNAAEDLKTSHMCAQLCSLMKAQLLKTYEEVVCRYGGHFDMSLMQGCQDVDPVPTSSPSPPRTPSPTTGLSNSQTYDIMRGEEVVLTAAEPEAEAAVISSSTAAVVPETGQPKQEEEEQEGGSTQKEGPKSPPCIVKVEDNSEVKVSAPPLQEPCGGGASDGFQVLEAAPDCHKFKLTMFQPTDPPHFYRTVRKEMKLLKTSLPPGIWVRGYEDRMDLYSVMIRGPERTPYEGGLFFFDFQLSADYPRAPPLCHYVTYCSDKLNPNLYEDGKVCVSLLGTWNGKGTEVWTSQSNLLQVIISIQGLILVSEPYFNEAGYERQKGTQQGRENSRMYNEMVVLKLIQAMAKVIQNPPEIFGTEIVKHFHRYAFNLVSQLEEWLLISENYNDRHPLSPTTPTTFREISFTDNHLNLPEYPLIPASKGFCITLHKTLEHFKTVLNSVGVGSGGVTCTSTGKHACKVEGEKEKEEEKEEEEKDVGTKKEDNSPNCT